MASLGSRTGHHGVQQPTSRPGYEAYKSPYGPNYKIRPNIYGIDIVTLRRAGLTAAAFGTVAGFFALTFFSDVPKVRKDIMSKLPIIGPSFIREIPPEDNPF